MLATVIGLGSIGRRRVGILEDLGIDVEGIDPNVSLPNVPPVEKVSGDVVFICTPPNVRRVPIEMSFGRPMFIEKPLAAPGCLPQWMIRALRNENIHVSENFIWNRSINSFFKELVGDSDSCRPCIYLRYNQCLSEWRHGTNHLKSYNAKCRYSIIYDSHEINLLSIYLGKPCGVMASLERKLPFPAFSHLSATFHWRDSFPSMISSSYSGEYLRKYSALGKSIHISPESLEESYATEVRVFLGGNVSNLEWALDAMSIHDALIKSHREKRWIRL